MVNGVEPYLKRTSHGMILGENSEKMSKSRGNVVNPDDIVNEYGADTLRMYEMFIGDFEKSAPWNSAGIKGCKRFLDRVWALQDILVEGDHYRPQIETAMHKTIKKVSEDIENLKFNTAIAAMMSLLNVIYDTKQINRAEFLSLLVMLNPFAPHITEELYSTNGYGSMMNERSWVAYDEAKCKDQTVEIAVQINGKIKAKINASVDLSKDEVLAIAKAESRIVEELNGKTITKEVVIPNKLINIVAK